MKARNEMKEGGNSAETRKENGKATTIKNAQYGRDRERRGEEGSKKCFL